jgi:hypothetical protein
MDGPYAVEELWKLPGFSLVTSVCPDGDFSWQPAGQYPAITRFLQRASSGDYDPDQIPAEGGMANAAPKLNSHNWREAVIGENLPDVKMTSRPVAVLSEPVAAPAKSLPLPAPVIRKTPSRLAAYRYVMLWFLLGVTSIGLCYPQTEHWSNFLSQISVNDASITAMGARFRQMGSPHAKGGWWKHKTLLVTPTITDKGIVAPASTGPEIEEIGSEDLGNGMISKTVVVTEIRDGIRVQQTKTYEVPAHPHKAKRKKPHGS